MGANCCILSHVALVYTVWTLTGVLNSLAHPIISITTITALSNTVIHDIPLLPLMLALAYNIRDIGGGTLLEHDKCVGD